MEALLNTGSTIDEGRLAKGGSKYTDDYTKECAVCWMCAEDFTSLGCPEKVAVISRDRKYSVAVKTKVTEAMRSGQVFIPRSIWANVVVEPDTFSTGSPRYKGAPVFVEPTDDEILSAEELVIKMYMGGK
ncbi:molybdopterin dinucleotide binding domain-containing protein [Methanolobus sediminis]|uniref:Molybdopterin dinucleotide binding domain-containing protein n=1 Tax=Methanolobus sediminis TaxID=3072978 RepID=A0AA51UJV3_9EURY|nr:molybdopterin dinucleotide binding domain-containing protein [Methanolobus sediminis]WMW24602.1 molybdopterin dinucleotide binding domain-containing protein [Methanolobus sediminis]